MCGLEPKWRAEIKVASLSGHFGDVAPQHGEAVQRPLRADCVHAQFPSALTLQSPLPTHCWRPCNLPRKTDHRRSCRSLRTNHTDAPVHIFKLLRWVLKKFAEIASPSRCVANVFFDKRNTPDGHWAKGHMTTRPTRRASRPFNEARSSAADNDRNLRIF